MPLPTNPEALSTLTFGAFMEASSHRHDDLVIPFLAPLPSLEDGRGVEGSKLVIMTWSFW